MTWVLTTGDSNRHNPQQPLPINSVSVMMAALETEPQVSRNKAMSVSLCVILSTSADKTPTLTLSLAYKCSQHGPLQSIYQ